MKTEGQMDGIQDMMEDAMGKMSANREETGKEALKEYAEQHPEQDVMAMLLKLPSDIKALELDLLDRKSQEDVLENQKSRIESETMSKVSDEVIDGKPRFSNEQKRQAETALRNSQNQEYKSLSEGLLTSKNASKKVEIGLKWRLNQLSAYKKIAELMAAGMRQ